MMHDDTVTARAVISAEVLEKLKRAAKREGVTPEDYLRNLIAVELHKRMRGVYDAR